MSLIHSKQQPLRLALIGPANVGKTHLAQMFQGTGITPIEIEELISQSEDMSHLLNGVSGKGDASLQFGRLFGFPWEDVQRYKRLQEKFLDIENNVIKDLTHTLRNDKHKSVILDFPGCVAHLPNRLADLRKIGVIIIYLEEDFEKLSKLFFDYPKAVIWGSLINEWKNKDASQLRSMFQKLLNIRKRTYQQYADLVIPWSVHRKFTSVADLSQYVPALTRAALLA